MKRAPITEDWSRFNTAVLEAADAVPKPAVAKQPAPLPPLTRPALEPADAGDRYGLIARHHRRKHA